MEKSLTHTVKWLNFIMEEENLENVWQNRFHLLFTLFMFFVQ